MAYDSSIPAGGPGNFVSPNLAIEHEGVRVDFITVDFISAMNGEVTHSLASANTAGLKLAFEAIQNQGSARNAQSLQVCTKETTQLHKIQSPCPQYKQLHVRLLSTEMLLPPQDRESDHVQQIVL